MVVPVLLVRLGVVGSRMNLESTLISHVLCAGAIPRVLFIYTF